MPTAACIDACLPDELLLHVLSFLPCLTARVLDGKVTLSSLGAAERVCRRWRRLGLGLAGQHPVDICFQEFVPQCVLVSPTAAREMTHCLKARSPAVVALRFLSEAVSLWEAVLLGLHLPAVRRLTFQGYNLGDALLRSLPHAFPALEELRTRVDPTSATDATNQGGAYPALLRLMPGLTAIDLCVPAITPDLVAAVLALPQLQSVRLASKGPLPGAATWQQLGQLGPRLRSVSLRLHNPGEQVPTELLGLPAMAELVLDVRRHDGNLEGLQQLPSLRRLEYSLPKAGTLSVPSSCWACSHLTALCLANSYADVPAGASAALSTLRRLELCQVELPEDSFPAEFCLLHQLTALKLDAMTIDPCLPIAVSNLSNLRELCITYPEHALEAEGLLVLRSLTALTHLLLDGCVVEGVPGEPMYPPSLQQLMISELEPTVLCTLLSPALFVSPSLQCLHLIIESPAVTEQARWWRLAAVLRGHQSLQELFVDIRDEEWGEMQPEEERRVWGQLQQKLGAAGVTAGLRHFLSIGE